MSSGSQTTPDAAGLRCYAWPISRWLIGLAIGTLFVGITSPLFVRSYLPLQVDSVRKTWVLHPGASYRWRSEGYATTEIGPLGMPGQTTLLIDDESPRATIQRPFRVALWGDSQAEGVALSDPDKLFAQIQHKVNESDGNQDAALMQSHHSQHCLVYPFARSGEDAAVWLTQVPLVDQHLSIDAHVFLVAKLADLASAGKAPLQPIVDSHLQRYSLAASLPAFIVQAARNLLFDRQTDQPRALRFRVGPLTKSATYGKQPPARHKGSTDWSSVVSAMARTTERPVLLVHAPGRPEIVDGNVSWRIKQPADVASLRVAATAAGIDLIDVTTEFQRSAEVGRWPHGFHNGQIGTGHLNATGYRIIADRVAPWLRTRFASSSHVEIGR